MTLYKFKNSYDNVATEMHEAPKEYETIEALVEKQNNSITNIENNINKKNKIIHR